MFLEALRSILDPRRVVMPSAKAPLVLTEEAVGSNCPPLPVRFDGEHWALRLRDNDHLPLLAELPKTESVRRLPDYLLFSAPDEPATRPSDVVVRILVCELKSSATGAGSAEPQVQLGKLLAEYLVRIAAQRLGRSESPKSWCSGLIVSAQIPASMLGKGKTRPGKVELPGYHDKVSGMRIHMKPAAADPSLASDDLWLRSIY